MSNSRKLRQPKKERAKVEPQQQNVPTLRQVRTALYHQERRGMVDRENAMWRATPLAMEHGYDRGVTVAVRSRRPTAAGLLKAKLSQADGLVRQGDIVRIAHPATGAAGAAHVRRVVARTGLMFLEPHWGTEPQKPVHRTQPVARAMAREQPEPCPACGAVTGEDCVTSTGKRAAWPHSARDPMLAKRPEDGTREH